MLLQEILRDLRGHFNILHQHSALRADCYLPGKSELARWEMSHRRQLTGPWGTAWFSPPEAVIVHKLIFYREGRSEKHLDDIRAMLDADSVEDHDTLIRWLDSLLLNEEWKTVQAGL